ncbi:hypothetical protein ALC53_14232 [Atta colombica]|uniref:Uncharacterized protein n=1 Tax=Atta colombica TaxID=520822 RepID=A0A195ATK8_9HYME|nr:hypothetical protein ALC53_14232 [Atta colombica]
MGESWFKSTERPDLLAEQINTIDWSTGIALHHLSYITCNFIANVFANVLSSDHIDTILKCNKESLQFVNNSFLE